MKPSFLLSSKAGKAFVVVCLSVLTIATSCSKKYEPQPEPIGEVKVRFVNASYGALPQDVYVNGTKKNVSGIDYGRTSEYFTITSGLSNFSFNDVGSTTVNISNPWQIQIGSKYSIFYHKNTEGKLALAYLSDDITIPAPPANKANVRFINFNSTLNANMTIYKGADISPLIPSLAYLGISDFFAVDAGTEFTFSANGWISAVDYDAEIIAGKNYTIWVDGNPDPNPNNKKLIGHVFEQIGGN